MLTCSISPERLVSNHECEALEIQRHQADSGVRNVFDYPDSQE